MGDTAVRADAVRGINEGLVECRRCLYSANLILRAMSGQKLSHLLKHMLLVRTVRDPAPDPVSVSYLPAPHCNAVSPLH